MSIDWQSDCIADRRALSQSLSRRHRLLSSSIKTLLQQRYLKRLHIMLKITVTRVFVRVNGRVRPCLLTEAGYCSFCLKKKSSLRTTVTDERQINK